MSVKLKRGVCAALGLSVIMPVVVQAQSGGRQIEEVVVTAERKESTVQDTSISVTALPEDFIEDFGIRNQEMLQNFIPSTTIQPFDVTIRGIGRNFRTLGGDPGVATYLNGVYSEDFGVTSTENALFDIARVEVLRGPQGTLYGRNAIGGAINFINNRPTQEFEGEIRTQVGRYNMFEVYGVLSGPIVQDKLAGRLVGSRLTRDGRQENIGIGNSDVNSTNDRNVSASLEWTPTDKFTVLGRFNDRDSRRDGTSGLFLRDGPLSTPHIRDTQHRAFGLRRVDPTVSPLDFGNFWASLPNPGEQTFTVTHPTTGEVAQAQYIRPGIDPASSTRINSAFGHFPSPSTGNPDYTDISTTVDINGDINDEEFEQQSFTLEAVYDFSDQVTLKYIYGWNDFDYRLEFDADLSSGTAAAFDWQSIETVQVQSHEIQLFWNPTDKLSITSGLYYFESERNQFLDFKDLLNEGRFVSPTVDPTGTIPSLLAAIGIGPTPVALGDAPAGQAVNGPWGGDAEGTYFSYDNDNKTEAIAVFSQMEWAFNDQFELTTGIRWSEDEKSGVENRFGYFEVAAFQFIPGLEFLPALGQLNLATGRMALVDPTNPLSGLVPTGLGPIFLQGIPISFADNLITNDSWDQVTWRINLDWTPDDDTLVYLSATTGYRSGGFNLGLRQLPNSSYDNETVIAYELGYKTQLIDKKLQLNLSAYYYDYEDYQVRVDGLADGPFPGTFAAVDIVQNAPEAENLGFEAEFLWLATDNLTVGGNASYTRTEYTADWFVSDDNNPDNPRSIFGPNAVNVKGNELNRIPDWKVTMWGNYVWRLDNGSRLDFYATYSWTDEMYFSPFNLDIDTAPSFDRIDLRVGWTSANEKWSITGWVNNLTDDIAVRTLSLASEDANWSRTAVGTEQRIWGLDFRYKF